MTTNDVKNPLHRIKVLERRIKYWEGEIVYIQDRIDIMKHEVNELKETHGNFFDSQTANKFMIDTGFR